VVRTEVVAPPIFLGWCTWRIGAPVHHTVHRKVRTYQLAIARYFDLVALHPFFSEWRT
jgi:hypothetical protein